MSAAPPEDIAHVFNLFFSNRMWQEIDVDPNLNPFELPDHDPRSVLRYTERAILKFCKDTTEVAKSLMQQQGYSVCMLKRTFDSVVNGVRIGAQIPPIKSVEGHLQFTEAEWNKFLPVAKTFRKGLFKNSSNGFLINCAKH